MDKLTLAFEDLQKSRQPDYDSEDNTKALRYWRQLITKYNIKQLLDFMKNHHEATIYDFLDVFDEIERKMKKIDDILDTNERRV